MFFFDFGALPPEINSGRMYAGPGSGPMMAAAAGWDALAAEMSTAAAGYGSVITELSGSPWVGPASASMAAAATPYVTWMGVTADQAEQAGMQARTAAGAFDAAFAMTVPPAVVAANRALLLALVATNFLGQNTPAIMATEAQYAEMWAQDAAAMYGYAATASGTASELNPFTEPPKTAQPNSLQGQAAAVGQAAATPAGNSAGVADATTSLTTQLDAFLTYWQFTVSPSGQITALPPWLVGNNGLIASVLGGGTLGVGNQGLANSTTNFPYFPVGTANFATGVQLNTLPPAVDPARNVLGEVLGEPLGGKVAAGLGQASKVGALSVPQGWSPSTPAGFNSVSAEPTGVGLVNATATNGGSSGIFQGMPMTGATGRRAEGYAVKYGVRHNVLTRPPSAG